MLRESLMVLKATRLLAIGLGAKVHAPSQRPPSGASGQPSDALYGQHSGTPRLVVLHLSFSSGSMDLGGFPNFCLPLPFLPLPVRCHLDGGGSEASSGCLRAEAEETDLQGSGSKWNTTLGSDSKDGGTESMGSSPATVRLNPFGSFSAIRNHAARSASRTWDTVMDA